MSEVLTDRRIPTIKHTQALEEAAIAVLNATDCNGATVILCDNPLDIARVRYSLSHMAHLFDDPSFMFHGEAHIEQAAARNLALIANLLAEHLKAGNT